MKRLFAFGCSLTYYTWPTWADLISIGFDEYYNFGVMGMGNQFIHHTVYEADSIFEFNSNDTVLVMFTNPFRNDSFIVDPLDNRLRWQPRGFIYQPSNNDLYTEEWRNKFWSSDQSYMQTWLAIKSIDHLLKSSKANYKLLPGISCSNSGGTGPVAVNDLDFISPYYNQIINMLHVTEPLFEWSNENYKKEDFYRFNGDSEPDQHPTISMHGKYVQTFMPELSKNLSDTILENLENQMDFSSQENNWLNPYFIKYRGKKVGSVRNWQYNVTNRVGNETFKK